MRRNIKMGETKVSPISSVPLRGTLAPLPLATRAWEPTRPKRSLSKIASAVLMAITVGVLLFEVGLLTRAQEGGESSAQTKTEPRDESSKCITAMAEVVGAEHEKIGQFMTEHFQSKKPTSELIPVAMERFRQYRRDIRGKMEDMLKPSQRVTIGAADAERPGCESFINEDFMLITNVIQSHILSNAYAKKSTRLLDKYKSINKKLDKLNLTIAQMAGYFGAFSQKLPCYATKCTKE